MISSIHFEQNSVNLSYYAQTSYSDGALHAKAQVINKQTACEQTHMPEFS